eukprot:scaffold1277_cov329-Prasinococcus_capsulatus_cf.AAC.4
MNHRANSTPYEGDAPQTPHHTFAFLIVSRSLRISYRKTTRRTSAVTATLVRRSGIARFLRTCWPDAMALLCARRLYNEDSQSVARACGFSRGRGAVHRQADLNPSTKHQKTLRAHASPGSTESAGWVQALTRALLGVGGGTSSLYWRSIGMAPGREVSVVRRGAFASLEPSRPERALRLSTTSFQLS